MVDNIVWYRDERIIRDLIRDFENSPERAEMLDGSRYYRNENDILNRQQFFWNEQHTKVVDETKANNKVAHAFMKLLVDEKIGYFLGVPPNITAEDPALQDKLILTMDEAFDDVLNDVGVEASNKGIGWLYAYIDPVDQGIGKLSFEMIPSEQVVPIWEDRAHQKLGGIINYYYMPELELGSANQKDVLKVECWHPEGVIFYSEYGNKLVEDIPRMFPDLQSAAMTEAGLPHFTVNGQGLTWGAVPFVAFRNNSQELNDLRFVRSLIDGYDKGVSDLANTMEEMRKLVMVIKNYQGTSLREFMDNLRFFGAVKVDDDGGVDKLDLSFNIEASEKYLDRLKKDFYQFGQGVEMSTDKFGANPSGVALKFLYSGLKLKTDNLERKFKSAFRQMFQIATRYFEATGQGSFDWKLAKVTFNRSEVSNVLEQIEAVASSMSLISEKTSIAKHPWVEDVDLEIEQKKQDQKLSLDQIPLMAEDNE